MTEDFHIPVLCNIAVEYLIENNFTPIHRVYVDGTLGGGGYAERICELSVNARLICFDKDVNSITFAGKRLEKFKERIVFVNRSFAMLIETLDELKIDKVSGIVLDLGLSSFQLNEEPGFSFMKDTVLDMRADKDSPLTAFKAVNEYDEDSLCKIFEEYGEVLNPEEFVNRIINKRKKREIKTTFDLVNIADDIFNAKGKGRIKLLARIFQALRIEVNSELEDLKNVLSQSLYCLERKGRIIVVSYHSLEDRIVKDFFKHNSKKEKISKYKNVKKEIPALKILTKKPILPGKEEVNFNPKSRSARLRVAERQ